MNVSEIIEKLVEISGVTDKVPNLQSVDISDSLIAGGWLGEVTGIVTTFMATIDVIRDTIEKGANLIITHEPTFYSSNDELAWLKADQVYQQKVQLITENQINIWRFHDYMHMAKPDLIYQGIENALKWENLRIPCSLHCYQIQRTSLKTLTQYLNKKLNVNKSRLIGNEESPIEKVGLLVGGASLGLGSETMPMEWMRENELDVVVCGEVYEWTLCAYIRDACQLGLNKALIVLGHNRSEEAGMKFLCDTLAGIFPDIPVWFSEAGEPFS